jgi:hypothetical protein
MIVQKMILSKELDQITKIHDDFLRKEEFYMFIEEILYRNIFFYKKTTKINIEWA